MIDAAHKKAVVISGASGYAGKAIVALLKNAGYTPIALASDITDEESLTQEALEIQKIFGTVSAIVHAASAPLVRKPLLLQSREDFVSHFSVNARGMFNLYRFFSPLLSHHGVIIALTSIAVTDASQTSVSGSYLPAKYALSGLLRVIAHELKATQIRVYAVAPAFMPGGLNADLPQAVRDIVVAKSAPEHATTPEKVAECVLMLIRGEGAPPSGMSISVPGGSICPL